MQCAWLKCIDVWHVVSRQIEYVIVNVLCIKNVVCECVVVLLWFSLSYSSRSGGVCCSSVCWYACVCIYMLPVEFSLVSFYLRKYFVEFFHPFVRINV